MNILGTRLALGALLEKPLGDCLNIDRSPFRGGITITPPRLGLDSI